MSQKIKKKPNSLQDYLRLSYPVTLYPEPEGGYVAMIKDLPGCMTQGETPDEVMANIEEARQLWIETAFEFGDEIPLPSDVLTIAE
jgi:antitoxin HicB